MASPTTSVNLSGVTGNVYAAAGYNTVYTNVPQNNSITLYVGAGVSAAQLVNPTYTTDTTTGFHNLQTINLQGSSTDYTVWSYYGNVVLTNKFTGQVVTFQLTKPLAGANNSGVTVEYLDGALAYTSNVTPNGNWTMWITKGGSDTSTWGTNSVASPYTAATALDQVTLGAAGANTLNAAVNSSDVTNWTGTGDTYTLTTNIETVPASGYLPQNATVTGVASDVGGTFQTGDTINGSGTAANNTLSITQAETAANVTVTATVNGVNNVNIKAVGAGVATYNTALWTGLQNFTITQGVGGDVTSVTNAPVSAIYGISSATNETLLVDFGGGASQTLNLSLNGAGSVATGNSFVDYVGANAQLKTIAVATTGNNFVTLNGTTSTTAVNVTGAGNNVIDLGGLNALSTSSAVTLDASAATGNNTIDIGANISSGGVTVKGSTGTSTTTIGLVLPAAATIPTITNVEGLQLDLGSNGILIASTPNTSITTLYINDVTAAANTDAYNLIGVGGVGSVVWGTTGGGNNQGGALTVSGSGALAETFALQTSATLSSGNSLTLGAQVIDGYTSVSINTAGGVGSAGSFTSVGVDGNALQSYVVTHGSTGFATLGTINSTNAAGTAGTLALIDTSAVAGGASFTIDTDTLATSSVVKGAVGATTITYAGGQTGASTISVVLQGSNNNYAVGAPVNTNQVITAGNGNNTIDTGTGTDVITVGTGNNNIDAGAGVNIITLGSGHFTAGNVNTVDIAGNGTTNTVNGFARGSSTATGDALDVTSVVVDAAQILTPLASGFTTASGTAVVSYTVTNGLITFFDGGLTAVTLSLADATNAQASVVAESAAGGFDAAGAYAFVAGSNTYYDSVNNVTGVTEAATLVGIQAAGITTIGVNVANYILVI